MNACFGTSCSVSNGLVPRCTAFACAEFKDAIGRKKWAELREALAHAKGQDLYRGAVDVTFHQDPLQAESHLRSVIRSSPKSEDAYEAYGWLGHRISTPGNIGVWFRRWRPAGPTSPAGRRGQEKSEVAGLRGLPDQVTVSVRPTTLRHEPRSIFIPLSVNGKAEPFFFDTGAWPNVIGESEAKRLGCGSSKHQARWPR